jgi:hypothetical protein
MRPSPRTSSISCVTPTPSLGCAADALDKASRQRPDLIAAHAETLITQIGPIVQQEVRWHVAQMIPRLPLTARQCPDAVVLLRGSIQDQSRIVVVEALTALTALDQDDAALRAWLVPELREPAAHRPPSLRSGPERCFLVCKATREARPAEARCRRTGSTTSAPA